MGSFIKFLKSQKIILTSNDSYAYVKVIGQGGCGHVISAIQSSTNQKVAIKFFFPENESRRRSKVQLSRFLNESEILNRYSREISLSPFPKWYDSGSICFKNKNVPFFVLELAKGNLKILGDLNKDFHKLGQTVFDLIDTISFLHSKGIVHRDIKPENFLVTEDDRILLTDFGIAMIPKEMRAHNFSTSPNDRLCNWKYWSPEVIEGKPQTSKSDLFSLGLLLSELISGFLWRGLGKNVGDYTDLYFANSHFIDNIIARLLQHTPEKRPEHIFDIICLFEAAFMMHYKSRYHSIYNRFMDFEKAKFEKLTTLFKTKIIGKKWDSSDLSLMKVVIDIYKCLNKKEYLLALPAWKTKLPVLFRYMFGYDYGYLHAASGYVDGAASILHNEGLIVPWFTGDEDCDKTTQRKRYRYKVDDSGLISFDPVFDFTLSPSGLRYSRYLCSIGILKNEELSQIKLSMPNHYRPTPGAHVRNIK